MGKKVFISHASEDKQIVSLFVDQILCAGSGVNIEDVIYTSRDDSGVVNGYDIPSCIKDGIKQAAIFFMMVSEKYKESEVCLNEMGAAWMRDELPKKILLMPGSGFNKIGWLMSLSKGTELSDSSGLDALHDQIIDILSTRIQTATWNRCKEVFLNKLNELIKKKSNENIHSLDSYENDKYRYKPVRFRRVFYRNLHKVAFRGIHRRFPQLGGVHFTETFISLYLISPADLFYLFVKFLVVVSVLFHVALIHFIKWRHTDIYVPFVYEFAHIAEEKR